MRKIFTLFMGLIFVHGVAIAQSTCASPDVISSTPYSATGLTTAGYGDDYDASMSCTSGFMDGDDYVFSYTPPVNETVDIFLTNTGTWVGLFVTDGCPDAGGTCVASDEQIIGNNSVTSVALTGGTTYYIIVSTYPAPQTTVFDISISNCSTPTALAAANVTATSADLSWTGVGGNYQVDYGTVGFTPGATATVTTVNPLAATGLSCGSNYEFYVREICVVGDTSAWAGPFTFSTGCCTSACDHTLDLFDSYGDGWNGASIDILIDGISTGPYTITTGSSASFNIPVCQGQIIDVVMTSGSYPTEESYTLTNNVTGLVVYSDGPSPDNGTVYTGKACPTCSGSGGLNASNATATSVVLGWTSPSGASQWNTEYGTSGFTLGTGNNSVTGANPFLLSSLTPNTSYDFYVQDICGVGDSSVWVGPLSFLTPPTCPESSNFGVGVLTDNSGQIFWTPGGASNWNVQFGTIGFTLGNGTIYNTTNDTIVLTGLMQNTTYDFYIQDSCGPGDVSAWIGPASFKTLCSPIVAPYVENFDTIPGTPSCWSTYNSGTDTETWLFWPINGGSPGWGAPTADHTGNGGNMVWSDNSFPQVPGITLESPLVDVSGLTTPGIRMFLFSENSSATGAAADWVQFSVDIWDGAAWNIGMYTFSGSSGGWLEEWIDLSTLTISGPVQARFIIDQSSTGCCGNDFAMDDIEFNELPSCLDPTAGIAFNATTTGVDLTWTSGGASNWNVQVDTAGFTLGNGTIYNATNDTITITGLNPITTYHFYVQDSCGPGNLSSWVGPFTFGTLCGGSSCDYVLNMFDSYGDGWNGATVEVYVNGVGQGPFGTGFTTGGNFTETIDICDGNLVEIVMLNLGGYPEEISFDFVDPSGITVFSQGNNPPASSVLFSTTSVCPSCVSSTGLGTYALGSDSTGVFWTSTSGATDFNLHFDTTGFTFGNGTTLASTSDSTILTGLLDATFYDVYVQDSCGNGNSSNWVGPVTFLNCFNSCNYTLDLFDSYGDGWNGASIDILVDGASTGPYTITAGSSASFNIPMCQGQTFDVVMTSGSYPAEESYTLTNNVTGLVVYSDGPSPTNGSVYTGTSCPACPGSGNISTVSVIDTSATITWVSGSGALGFNIEYGVSPLTPGAGTTMTLTNDTVVLNGLTPQTTYDFWVQDSCGTDISAWVGPFTFTTACVTIVAPYTENFDTIPGATFNCWSTYNSGPDTKTWLYWPVNGGSPEWGAATADHTGNGGNLAWVDNSLPQVPSVTLESPPVDVSTLTTPAIEMFIFSENSDATGAAADWVQFSVDIWDGAAWNIGMYTFSGQSNGWMQVFVDLSTLTITGPTKARFIVDQSGTGCCGNDFMLDDVSWLELPSCLASSALGAINTLDVSSDIFWTTGGAANWNVEWGTAGFMQGMGTTVVATNDTLNITGLTANTSYDFYVQDSCGLGDVSSWTGPFTFTTACATYIAPYMDNFDAGGWLPGTNFDADDCIYDNCWTATPLPAAYSWRVRSGTTASSSTGPSGDNTTGSANYLYTEASSGLTGDVAELISPFVDVSPLTIPTLFYHSHFFGVNIDSMYVDVYDGSTWTAGVDTVIGQQQTASADPWSEQVVDLSAFAGNVIQVRFRATRGNGFGGDMAIDDFRIDEAPCSPVATIDLGNDTTVCAGTILTFDPNGPYDSYLWSNGSTDSTLIIAVDTLVSGTYVGVEVTEGGNNCPGTDSIMINVNPIPVVNLGSDTTICDSDSLVFDAGAGFVTYTWCDGSTGQTNVFNAATAGIGTHTVCVSVTNLFNCPATDTIVVTVASISFDLGNDTTICDGQSVTLDAGVGFNTYLWSTGDSTQTITTGVGDTYTCNVSGGGCTTSDDIVVAVNPAPVFSLGTDSAVCIQSPQFTLTGPVGMSTYLWFPSGSTAQNFTVNPSGLGLGGFTYILTVEDGSGCAYTDSITIVIEDCTSLEELYGYSIDMYPNPTGETFTLTISGDFADRMTYSIVSVDGKLVYAEQIGGIAVRELRKDIDVSNYARGVYFIELDTPKGRISKKLIVQ